MVAADMKTGRSTAITRKPGPKNACSLFSRAIVESKHVTFPQNRYDRWSLFSGI